jgi:hypothetical protein
MRRLFFAICTIAGYSFMPGKSMRMLAGIPAIKPYGILSMTFNVYLSIICVKINWSLF